jgi:hypothetical protein
VTAHFATIGGGANNAANGLYSLVAGGVNNTTGANFATAVGGIWNTASGEASTVGGGAYNIAAGRNAFAAGWRAKALHDGAFVWADITDSDYASTAANQFRIRATGGVILSPETSLTVGGGIASGANLSVGGTDIYLRGRGGGAGNNGGAARALVDGGPTEGLVLNYGNDFGWVRVGSGMTVNGSLYVTSLPFGDQRNVQWDNVTGQFYYDNSSRKHKQNLTPLKDDFEKLLQAVPMTYTRPGAPDRWEIGFIAEEFDELGLKKLVDYAPDGKTPEGINYEKICLYLTAIARKQATRLEEQRKQMEALRQENQAARKENTAIQAENARTQQRLEEVLRRLDALEAEKR